MAPRLLKSTLWLLLMLLGRPAAYALRPDRVYHTTPDSVGASYQADTVRTPDGYTLKTWTYTPDKAKDQHTTIILAYGDVGNMSYYVHQARALSAAGYQVVSFDYRGFGASSDFALDTRFLYYQEFVDDLQAVAQATRRQQPKQRLGIWGLSMGTIMATQVAAERGVDFLVAEGLVTDPVALVARIKQTRGKDVLLPSQAPAYHRLLTGLRCPVLLFGGSKDLNTPLADSQAMLAKVRRRNWQLIEFDGGHMEGFPTLSSALTAQGYGDGYIADIEAFLRKQH